MVLSYVEIQKIENAKLCPQQSEPCSSIARAYKDKILHLLHGKRRSLSTPELKSITVTLLPQSRTALRVSLRETIYDGKSATLTKGGTVNDTLVGSIT